MALLFIFLLPIIFMSRNIYLLILGLYNISGRIELICLYSAIFSFLFLLSYGMAKFILPLIFSFVESKKYSDNSIGIAIKNTTILVLNKLNIDSNEDFGNAFNSFQVLCFIPVTLFLYIFWVNYIIGYLLIIPIVYCWFEVSYVINRYYKNKEIKQL